VLPFILWACWHDADDMISTTPHIRIPGKAKKIPIFERSPLKIFEASLYLSLACRLLLSQTISKATADEGQKFLQQFCLRCLHLRIPMVPNHHMAMHYSRLIRLYGPVYGWWLFAFERFNGMLKSVNTNGHANGEMEITLMRNWMLRQRIYDLVRIK
jgi:hypothetical protein